MKKFAVGLISFLALLCMCGIAGATIIDVNVATALSFQDEGTLTTDQTALLTSLDGNWAPEKTGTVTYDFYATGTSPAFFDAVSLHFDLSSIGWANIQNATLRFYTQKGNYSDNTWQHYEVLQGAQNPTDQDYAPFDPLITGPIVNFGLGSVLAKNSLVGWLEASINTAWIDSDAFDVTLRLWNARLDKVELEVAPVPEPATMLLLGSGLVGLAGFRKRFRKA